MLSNRKSFILYIPTPLQTSDEGTPGTDAALHYIRKHQFHVTTLVPCRTPLLPADGGAASWFVRRTRVTADATDHHADD